MLPTAGHSPRSSVRREEKRRGVEILREVLEIELEPRDRYESLLFVAHGLAALGFADEAAEARGQAATLADAHGFLPPPVFAEARRPPGAFGEDP